MSKNQTFKKLTFVWNFITLAKYCEGISEKDIYFAVNLEYYLGGGTKIDNPQIRIFSLDDPSPWRDSDLGIVPNIDWAKQGDKFKNLILERMDKSILPGIKENVINDFYLTPDYFEKDLATLHGSGFSIQPKFSQSAYFRFHNQSEVYKNLYFVGAGTHPGAGMPGVLSSAKVLDKLF